MHGAVQEFAGATPPRASQTWNEHIIQSLACTCIAGRLGLSHKGARFGGYPSLLFVSDLQRHSRSWPGMHLRCAWDSQISGSCPLGASEEWMGAIPVLSRRAADHTQEMQRHCKLASPVVEASPRSMWGLSRKYIVEASPGHSLGASPQKAVWRLPQAAGGGATPFGSEAILRIGGGFPR